MRPVCCPPHLPRDQARLLPRWSFLVRCGLVSPESSLQSSLTPGSGQGHPEQRVKAIPRNSQFLPREEPPDSPRPMPAVPHPRCPRGVTGRPLPLHALPTPLLGCSWLDSVCWHLLCPQAPWWLCWAWGESEGCGEAVCKPRGWGLGCRGLAVCQGGGWGAFGWCEPGEEAREKGAGDCYRTRDHL